MSQLEARLVLRAVDQASGVIRRVGGALRAINGRSAAMAAASMQRMNAAMHGPGSYAAAMAGGLLLSRQYTFEKSLNRTQAILNQTSREGFAPLRDEIVRVAGAYPAMRDAIAKGASELAMAGMAQGTVQAVLEKTVQGAMASGESIATVGAGVTDVIMGMAMPFKTAAEQAKSFAAVNDKLAAAATSYNQTYTQFLSGLGKTAPVARVAGVSLQDLAATLGVLANAKFKGEEGGTGLRTLMLRLGSPTKKARAELRAFNIDLAKFQKASSFRNAGGKTLTERLQEELGLDAGHLIGIFDTILKNKALTGNANNLGDALNQAIVEGLGVSSGDAESRAKIRDVVARYVRSSFSTLDVVGLLREVAAKNGDKSLTFLNEVGGKYHAAKLAALVSAIRDGYFDGWARIMAERTVGATQRFADITMQGIVGAWAKFTSAIDVLMEKMLVDTGIMGELTALVNKVRDFVIRMQQVNPQLLKIGTYAMLAMAVLAPLGLVFAGVASAIGLVAGAVGLLLSPWVLLIGMIAAGAYMIYNAWDNIKEAFANGVEAVGNLVSRLGTAVYDGLMAGWDALVSALQNAWNRIVGVFQGAADRIMSIINAIRNGMAAIGNFTVNNKLTRGLGIAPDAPKVDGARASGGDVRAGHTYRINERGQEFFTPSRSGRIIPNHRVGGVSVTAPITVNITAAGANAAEIIRQAKTRLREELQAALRGAIADTGLA